MRNTLLIVFSRISVPLVVSFTGYRYLVAWSGLPLHSATWEPRVHLCDPRDNVPNAALAEYEKSHGFLGNPPADPALHRKLLAQNQR